MKILVPLDGSRLADGMLSHARRLLLREASTIALLHVLPVDPPATQEGREKQQAEAEEHLKACKDLLESTGESVTTSVLRGDAAEQILEFVDASGADLCAMATHGRSGPSRWIRGSVAERVLRNAKVPIFLANPKGLVLESDAVRFERILVPFDGSPLAAQILPVVGRFASDSDSEVTVLHIDTPERGGHPVPEVARRHAQQRAEAMLDEVRCALEESGVEKTQVLGRYSGDPAGEILKVIEEVKPDLVAMSSHGRTGFSRFAFGSVAEKVLRKCDCPLLVRPAQRKG